MKSFKNTHIHPKLQTQEKKKKKKNLNEIQIAKSQPILQFLNTSQTHMKSKAKFAEQHLFRKILNE